MHLTCPRPTQSSLTSNIRFPYSTGNSPVLQLLNKLVPLVLVVSILQNNVKSVDDTRDVTKNGQKDVDKEIGTTSSLKEDTKRRQDDCQNDLEDV